MILKLENAVKQVNVKRREGKIETGEYFVISEKRV